MSTINTLGGFPRLLQCVTVHLRARIDDHGWNSILTRWGGSDNPAEAFSIITRPAVDDEWDGLRQNYLAFPDESGRCDVIEAVVGLRCHNPEWSSMRVGVPAARIGKGLTHDIILRFNGASLSLHIDGVLVDEDWPMGRIPAGSILQSAGEEFDGEIELVELLPRALSEQEIVERCGGRRRVEIRTVEILGSEDNEAQYWTPRGHNQWVGDVLLGDTWAFDQERLHLFYLIDRRHGASKFFQGGHFIAHMSSSDLVHWEQHPTAVELDEWSTLGTGRPFVHDGKLAISYGLHTSRLFPDANVLSHETNADGSSVPLPYSSDGMVAGATNGDGKYPMGATFATSADGVHFQKSNLLIHGSQNPSVLRDSRGSGYLMPAGYGSTGLWGSDDLKRWRLLDPDIIPYGELSPTRNSSECQCLFEWNGWHYIIGGRTGFWMSRNQTGPFWSGKDGRNAGVYKPRWDLNEGLWVPMVAEFKDNRRILAGFLAGPGFGWAGHLVFRELIQFEDGSLGLKWPKEMIPQVKKNLKAELRVGSEPVSGSVARVGAAPKSWAEIDMASRSVHLSLRIAPGKGASHVAIAGLGEDGEGCALSFLLDKARAQWSEAIGGALPQAVPTLSEIILATGKHGDNPSLHYQGGDFAITSVEGLDTLFSVELLFVYDAKSMSTIIDARVGGCRTMITRRKGLVLKTIRLMADGPADFEIISMGRL